MQRRVDVYGVNIGPSGDTQNRESRQYNMTYILKFKKVRKQIRKMPNWKIPGPNGVQGYWIKNLCNLHNSNALQLDRCLQENNLPK